MKSDRIYLRQLTLKDAESLLALRNRNRDFFQTFEPIRPDSHFTLEGQKLEINNIIASADKDQAYYFGIFLLESDELIGRIALTGIARGPFQNAYLGYYLDQQHNGKGYTTEAVYLCVKFAFEHSQLHRVQAGVMPRNVASIRVLEKVGFKHEGFSEKYLKINGVWEDHSLYAITIENFK